MSIKANIKKIEILMINIVYIIITIFSKMEESFDIFIPSVPEIDGGVQFSDPSPSPDDDDYDNNDDIDELDTEEDIYRFHLNDSLDKSSDGNQEIKQINDKLTKYYDRFSSYCRNFKITKNEFIKILDEFNQHKKNYYAYQDDLKDRMIINEDNPTLEDCPFVLDIPIIKSKIESIRKLITLIEDTFSRIYILKIMNK